MFTGRFYRSFQDTDRWITSRTKKETSDLYIRSTNDVSAPAETLLTSLRDEVKEHCQKDTRFMTSLQPLKAVYSHSHLVQSMYRAADQAGVGPMAAVAGAIAQQLGKHLLPTTNEIIIENGGDIWLSVQEKVIIHIYTGSHYFENKIALVISPENSPCAICTSSSTIGESLSFGKADTATIITRDAALADALATATCNMVQDETSIEPALNFAIDKGALGALIILRDKIAMMGDLELADITQ